MTLTIELDNYVFELKSKDPNAYLNRGVVHILSTNKTTNEKTNFIVYRSHSDLGFWRLCYTAGKEDDESETFFQFLKGNHKFGHYVQTTFIDLRLQMFINDNFLSIPEESNMNCFDLYESHPETKEKVIEMIDTKHGNRKGLPSLNESLVIPEKVKNIHNNSEIVYANVMNFPLEFNYRKKFGWCGRKPKHEQVITGSLFLQDNYTISGTQIISPYNYNASDAESFSLELTSQLGVVDLTKKSDANIPPELTLYYLHILNLNIEDSREVDETKRRKTVANLYLPVFLCQSPNLINAFGLYDNYFDLGAYVCKLIDYTKNCLKSDGELKCSVGYNLQSYLYKDPVFPFNEISKNYSITPFVAKVVKENRIKDITSLENLLRSLQLYKTVQTQKGQELEERQFFRNPKELEGEIANNKRLLAEIDTNIQKYTDILEQFKIKNQFAGRKKRRRSTQKKNKRKKSGKKRKKTLKKN